MIKRVQWQLLQSSYFFSYKLCYKPSDLLGGDLNESHLCFFFFFSEKTKVVFVEAALLGLTPGCDGWIWRLYGPVSCLGAIHFG